MRKPIEASKGDALILVDVQKDFLPGGPLAVPGGDAVVGPLNRCVESFSARALPVLATRDWHPSDHCSFTPQGGPWPPHCVAGTPGAEFADALELPERATIVSKATTAGADAYSGFQETELAGLLRERGVSRLFVGGLATDYCVLHTVSDGLAEGFEVLLVEDAVRAVDLKPGDGRRAIETMRQRGARLLQSTDLLP